MKADQFGDFTYYLNDESTITIYGYTGPGGNVIIPATIVGVPVTTIYELTFNGRSSLTSITLPNSLTSIGNFAFGNCTALTSVTFPSSVTNLGGAVFVGCTALTAINVAALNPNYSSADGVLFDKSQETLLLYPYGKLGSYTPPNSVKSIGEQAFGECPGLTSVTIPSSVTNIGAFALTRCPALMAINVDALHPSYSSADGVLFDKVRQLLIQYPGGKIGSYTTPDSVIAIGLAAFDGCTNLASVTLPNVTSIEENAFSFCRGLASVSLPKVVLLGVGSFYGTGLTSVKLPNVTSIGSYAFQECFGLTNVTLANSLTNIGYQAFLQTGLTSVTIPSSVTTIDGAAFAQTELTSVTLPNSLTKLNTWTFRSCHRLTTVILPKSLTSIGEQIFKAYPSDGDIVVTGVYFKGNAPSIVGSNGDVFYGADNVTVYYRAGTTGWGSTFAGRPTALWVVPTYSQWAASFNLAAQYPNASGPQDDADQDGVTNAQEMAAGTDPTNAGSALRLEPQPKLAELSADDQTPPDPDQFALYFQTIPGTIYELQNSPALGSPWKSVATVTATTAQKRVLVNKPATKGFYRVFLTP